MRRATQPKAVLLDRFAAELRPVRTEGLTEHLVRQMRACILRGVIRPGERFPPERELAAMLQVSRPSLRQALKALQMMGVLEVTQGSGTYLAQSAAAILQEPADLLVPLRGLSFAELYEARRALEAEAAACAAIRAAEPELGHLAAELAQMRAHAASPRTFVKHDMAFHRHIAAASGNSLFIWFIELIQKALAKGQVAHTHNVDVRNLIRDHERILAAVREGAPDRARQEMLNHLTLTRAYADQQSPVELRVLSRSER